MCHATVYRREWLLEIRRGPFTELFGNCRHASTKPIGADQPYTPENSYTMRLTPVTDVVLGKVLHQDGDLEVDLPPGLGVEPEAVAGRVDDLLHLHETCPASMPREPGPAQGQAKGTHLQPWGTPHKELG